MVTGMTLLTAAAGLSWVVAAMGAFERPQVQDDLLEKLVGKWHITREFPKRKAENEATAEWVLDHHYLRIMMKDLSKPAQYEAHVYITYEAAAKRYGIHWLDVFAGSIPEMMGYGERKGDSIVFTWKDADGTLRNTFTWHPESKSWISKIEQTDANGKWSTFCTDIYRKR